LNFEKLAVLSKLIVSALGQVSARVAARDIGIEVGGVIGQQTPTHQLFFFPQSQ
jgi:hypothetical protein